MLWQLLKFERRLILGSALFWMVAVLFGAMAFGTMASDNVSIGGAVGNVLRNAPGPVVDILGQMSIFSMLLSTIFVAGAALRDFEQRTAELFFVTPMKRRDYLLGRFGGGFAAALAILVVTAFGLWLGTMMPWLDPTRLGPTPWLAFVWAFMVLVVPNLLFVSALLFCLSTVTRSMLATYIGVIAFFVLWTVAGVLTSDLDSRWIGALLDPSGSRAIGEAVRYWSSTDLNTRLPPISGMLLANRALWIGLTALLMATSFRLFRADREGLVLFRRKALLKETADAKGSAKPVPAVHLQSSASARFTQLMRQARFDLKGLIGGAPFLVMLVLGLLLLFVILKFGALIYGTAVYPVTARMIGAIDGALRIFMIILITFGAGELVWRERTMGVAEATDAYATPNWLPLTAKLIALLAVVAVMHLAGITFTVLYQLGHGYTQLELPLYLKGAALDLLAFSLTAVLALFLQVMSGNKFMGYLLMVAYFVLRIVLGLNDFTHPLYFYGSASRTPWSDMNGYGHFLAPHFWMRAYWAAFALGLLATASLFWQRGTLLTWKERVAVARQRLRHGPAKAVLVLAILAFAGLGTWIFINTNVRNHYVAGNTQKKRAAEYEKTYRQYKDVPQPRITDVRADVDIFPEARSVTIRGHYRLQNKNAVPVTELHVRINPDVEVKRLEFPAHSTVKDDRDFGYTIYKFNEPLAPGASMDFDFEIVGEPHGFPADGGDTAIVQNGTFFNNEALPHFGYDTNAQLSDRNDRKKYDLPELPRMPPITDEAARVNTYIGRDADWINFETTVSTSTDQIALAPGYLQREWTENGRHYFHYKSDTRILAFVSWLSARWEVKRDRWNDIAIEVYYDAKHPYNVDGMIAATKKSLDYYTKNFSPYQFRQVRILEFPGYAAFAQSFANTIPYSEAIGFIADVRDQEDIDYTFYVTAHEVAHQWWAHQVIGANMQGATMLSESLAQYSALMVMEHEYGAAKMRKFLKYELDTYLRMRATERVSEQPLALNENQQYIHYNKGSVVFYALKDYIGEDVLNGILAKFLKDKAFQEAPFTTSRELLDYIRQGTDPKFKDLIDDLFERIVFLDHRTVEASAHKREDGKYVVTLKLHAGKFVADAKGKEKEEPVDEWVDVGVFARAPGAKESTEKVLYLQKHHFTQGDTSVDVVVDAEPYDAGIDPLNKLVDRDSDDNRKRITLKP